MNNNQRASIAVALAGTRQQSRLIAVMNDFDRTLELIETSQQSAGATTAQHAEYMQGMEAAMVGLQDAWQTLIRAISDSELIIDIVGAIASSLESIVSILEALNITGEAFMVIVIMLIGTLKLYKPIGTLFTKSIIASQNAFDRLANSVIKSGSAIHFESRQTKTSTKLT